ncbi:clpC [Symbiodinium natans]|uniref:ClpC protein n=1 Tax=Symbiodinium natans TaxID=878477 RepID=A0A812RLN7_9DINO|nr:clpC [Symbiodinium natans]
MLTSAAKANSNISKGQLVSKLRAPTECSKFLILCHPVRVRQAQTAAKPQEAAAPAEEEEDDEDFQEEIPLVSEADVAQVVSKWTGVPVDKVSTDESARLETLHDRVIGQEEAVTAVSKAVRRARSGLKNPNRPIASFIFCGPTGVGKTELCKALSAAYFGKEDAMIRLDMSEPRREHTVSKLIGSPPGYVGYDEESQLTDGVRRRPYSLVLFDEVEKAHPDVFNLCLQILEDGRLTDSKGRTVSFKNTLIIMTSNVGAKAIEKGLLGGGGLGFSGLEEDVDTSNYQRLKTVVHDELKNFFRPEFLNRLDEIIVFKSLNKQEVAQIAELEFRKVFKLCVEKGIKLSMTDRFKKKVVDEGFNPVYGARPLRRAITRLLEDTLAESFLEMCWFNLPASDTPPWLTSQLQTLRLKVPAKFLVALKGTDYGAWLMFVLYTDGQEPVQTPWQQRLVRQVHATARQASAAAEEALHRRLDSPDIRQALEKCCPSAASLPAPALAERLRAEVRAAEVVSGFSTEVNASWFSFSLDEAERVPYYENLWEVWVRNRAEISNYSFGLDWVEVEYLGFKPFEVHAMPRTMAEAQERAPYFALNALRMDAGSPLYGDVTLVLRPSVAHAVSIISGFDTGSWTGMCNKSFTPPAGGFDHDCSAYPGHAGLGSFEAFDHLFLINEQYWHNAHTLERLLVRALTPDSALTGPDFVHYFEVLPAARLKFPDHIKFVIASFPGLFGTARGERVRAWCRRYGWTLLWSLGLNLGFTTDFGMPHFWDLKNQSGPFWDHPRLLDPETVGPAVNATCGTSAVFAEAWAAVAAARAARHLVPKDWAELWAALASKVPAASRISPLRAFSCADPEGCLGITEDGDCVCTTASATETDAMIV